MKYLILCLLGVITLFSCNSGHDSEAYRIVRDPTWSPLDFIGKERAVLAFSDDLMREIAKEEEFRVSLFSANWGQMRDMLRRGEVDGMLTSLPPTTAFRDIYDFSDVYLHVGPVLVVATDSDIHSLDEMKDKIVGVLSGSPSMLVVAKIPDIVIHDFMSNAQALEACAKGKIDGVVMEALPAYAFTRDLYQRVLHVVTPPLTEDGLRLVVLKGHNEALVESFNEGLKEMHEEGSFDELQKKWGLDLEQGPPFMKDSLALGYVLHILHGPSPKCSDQVGRV